MRRYSEWGIQLVSDRTKIGSVGNDNVDPSAIPTELFEMDQANKLLKLRDDWLYADRFQGNTREVTGSDTILETDSLILVNTASAVTLTLTAGLPIGKTISIMRTVASTNAVTVARSGSETIEGSTSFVTHGATGSASLNNQIVRITKTGATTWEFTDGIISGYVSGRGWYIKFGDGTMIQTYWENIQRVFITYTPVSPSGHMCASTGWVWTYPVPFVGNMPRSFICGDVSWGPGLESHLAYPTSTPLTTCNIEVVIGATANASLYVASSYYTIGRWKA
jgi:hypothetical protein